MLICPFHSMLAKMYAIHLLKIWILISWKLLRQMSISLNTMASWSLNTMASWQVNAVIEDRSKIIFGISTTDNHKPSDPSTLLTSMMLPKQIAGAKGQQYVVLTSDLQIYRVCLQIMWCNPSEYSNFFMRLGGMHLLMSFVGCFGMLQEDSGLGGIINEAFSGGK